MDKFENIDDLFANLGNDEKQAPSGAWEYILADQKRKRRAGLLWWYYGTAGLLLIGGLMGYYQLKSDKSTLQTNHITKNEVSIKAENNTTKIYNNTIAETPNTTRIDFANVKPNTPFRSSSYLSKTTKEQKIVSENITSIESIGDINPDATQVAVSKENTSSDIAETLTKDQIKNKDLTKEEDEKEKTIRKTPKPKIQKYFVEPTLMGTYNSRNLKGGADMTNYINQRNASEVRLLSYAVGINAGMQLNKNLNIQSGLLYNVQGLSASYTVSTAQRRVFVEVDPTLKKYDTTANYIYIHDSAYKLEKGNGINGDQKFHYIRIPVMAEWQMNIKKTANIFYAGAGMSFNILIAARGDIQDYQSTQSGVFVPINQVSLQRLGVDFMGRAGVLVPCFGMPDLKMSFGLRGMYSPISAFSKDIPIKQHNYTLALEVGIRKFFK